MKISEIIKTSSWVLFAVLSIVQITPIKINPWSKIIKWIGKALNGDVLDRIEANTKRLNEHIENDAVKEAKSCRMRIIRFNDEELSGREHSKEHWNDVLDDIDWYERYCAEHPDYKNNKAMLTIENIKCIYLEMHKTSKPFLGDDVYEARKKAKQQSKN